MNTANYIKLCDLWEQGIETENIAKELDISVSTVRTYIHRHRDEFPHRRHHVEWWAERLKSVESLSCARAGKVLGCTANTISYWRRKVAEHAVHGTH